jgi:hypothetical protein
LQNIASLGPLAEERPILFLQDRTLRLAPAAFRQPGERRSGKKSEEDGEKEGKHGE